VVTNPIIVAIDTSDGASALALAGAVADSVGAFKVGLGLLHGPGPGLIGELHDLGRPVFVDAKLHDIPSQVERAAHALGRAGARWLTAHVSGGSAMLEAAVAGLAEGSGGTGGVLGVSVLTSLDAADLAEVGIDESPEDLVARMARVAESSGAEGVVCSPREISIVRAAAPRVAVVTPGIRPTGSAVGDQRRTATPLEALTAGATWLVIGRPITAAADPAAAAAEMAAQVNA
jgi:orotidine-5'-phosphate decarboxylase